jgi:hypothetical protein
LTMLKTTESLLIFVCFLAVSLDVQIWLRTVDLVMRMLGLGVSSMMILLTFAYSEFLGTGDKKNE